MSNKIEIQVSSAIVETLKERGTDKYGSGFFGASRGARKHQGIDYYCPPGKLVLCPFEEATVTKFGYPYADDLSYRYIELTTKEEDGVIFQHQFFYVAPDTSLSIRDRVFKMGVIGCVQDLDKRYKGILNHIHYQIKNNGYILDPQKYWDKYMPKS